jgi:hypothetical protein
VEAPEENRSGSKGGDKDSSPLKEFKDLAAKSGKFVHGVAGCAE